MSLIGKGALVLMVAALGPLAVVSAATAATTVARADPGAGQLAAGTTLAAASEGTFTLIGVSAVVRCNASIGLTLQSGDGSPSIAGTVSALTLSACFDTIPSLNLDECTAVAPFGTMTATAAAGGGTITLTNTFVRCHVMGSGTPGVACYLRVASAAGAFANANSTLSYASVPVTHSVPAGATDDFGVVCPQVGVASVNFADLHTTGGTAVTLTTA